MRCSACRYRNECDYRHNDITTFQSCDLIDSFRRRHAPVSDYVKGYVGDMTTCMFVGLQGMCGEGCPAFDVRLCNQ